jgi:hypothetical protein
MFYVQNGNNVVNINSAYKTASASVTDRFKFKLSDYGFNDSHYDSIRFIKSGETALDGKWFSQAEPSPKYFHNGSPVPFVPAYGAVIPRLDNFSGQGAVPYYRWNSTSQQIEISSDGNTWSSQYASLTGLMFIELQGAGGGGGGGYLNAVTGMYGGGGGGGGGAYCSMLVNMSAFKYLHIVERGAAGTGGGENADGTTGGDTTISFKLLDDTAISITACGGTYGRKGYYGTPGTGGTVITNPETINLDSLKVIHLYHGKGGGKGGADTGLTLPAEAGEGGSFISTDTRGFGDLVSPVSISGGNTFDLLFGSYKQRADGGGGGASALWNHGRGSRGQGGQGGAAYKGSNGDADAQNGKDGTKGVVYIHY